MNFKVIAICVLIIYAGLFLGCNRVDSVPTKTSENAMLDLTQPITPTNNVATPTILPTETESPSPTPIVFLTVAAMSNGCLLQPSVVLPVDSRGNVNPVLTGISGSDDRFCIMWDSNVPNATEFIVEISYMNGEVFTQTVPSNVSYTIMPERESPNCTDRTSYQLFVKAVVNENTRLIGGLAVHDGCR